RSNGTNVGRTNHNRHRPQTLDGDGCGQNSRPRRGGDRRDRHSPRSAAAPRSLHTALPEPATGPDTGYPFTIPRIQVSEKRGATVTAVYTRTMEGENFPRDGRRSFRQVVMGMSRMKRETMRYKIGRASCRERVDV